MSEEHQRVVAQAISSLRIIMMLCTDEERRMIIEQVVGDYCEDCGSKDRRCQCWNDE